MVDPGNRPSEIGDSLADELAILMLEDAQTDRELVERKLRDAGMNFKSRCVQTKAAFLEQLDAFSPDIILSDYLMPEFTGMEALKLLKQRNSALPLIILTGSMNEEVAVECMQAGAADYVLKENLVRLPLAIERSLKQRKTQEEKAATEMALLESQARYQRITEALTDYVSTVYVESGVIVKTTYAEACFPVTGYTKEEFEADPDLWIKIVHEQDREPVLELVSRVLAHQSIEPIIHRLVRKDGRQRWVTRTIVPHGDHGEDSFTYDVAVRDISAQKQLEEELRQSQKMEAIGQLAGGIAHDFNNILQTMICNIEFAYEDVSKDSRQYQDLQEINKSIERAASLTRQLLVLSRRQVLQLQNVELNNLIDGLLKMIRRIIGEDIKVNTHSGAELDLIHADPGQLEQVLMNLVANARDAMPDGGAITITTKNVLIDAGQRDIYDGAQEGRHVVLCVPDTGCGMDEETQSQIFEPFFTTKDVGEGTGLGLATVYGIVKQHKGFIQTCSKPGEGTSFKIYFPALSDTDAISEDKHAEKQFLRGTETILYAEDEESVRLATVQFLTSAGYRVLVAEDGSEARDLFKAHQDEIALMLLDIVMPKLGGWEVYQEIVQLKPDVRVIFSTGYKPRMTRMRYIQDRDLPLLQKPYQLNTLLARIREVLDAEV